MDLDLTQMLEELRAELLKYTRQALGVIPARRWNRILDLGCGSGQPTVELARQTEGQIAAIDVDGGALSQLHRRLIDLGLVDRVQPVRCSALTTAFRTGSFDLLWDEGTIHLLDPGRAFAECARLLAPGGFLVMGETTSWFERHRGLLSAHRLEVRETIMLPSGCWWTEYYAPLKQRIVALCATRGLSAGRPPLQNLMREVSMVEADPSRFDCGFFLATRLP